MDPSQIGNMLLALAVAVGSIGTWLSTSQRKMRARNKQFTKDIMAFEIWVAASIKSRTVHNAKFHANDDNGIDIPPLPEPMSRMEVEE